MEKLKKTHGDSKTLSDAQREEIAEIDKKYEAQLAEQRLTFDAKISTAPPEEVPKLKEDLADVITGIEAKRKTEKEAIWDSA